MRVLGFIVDCSHRSRYDHLLSTNTSGLVRQLLQLSKRKLFLPLIFHLGIATRVKKVVVRRSGFGWLSSTRFPDFNLLLTFSTHHGVLLVVVSVFIVQRILRHCGGPSV